ncbi:MAG TPA: formyltetrahydrofolate deformylase [Cytophagales bacterium]|jgi:formyltetrahydrofolate deformylase|nr:formyltetrahydrofolate deformylase [Cytophagales bacterium]
MNKAGHQFYVLKIDCPDAKGLVHQISGIFYHHGLNMVENEEFVDIENGHFYMRSEFEGHMDPVKVVEDLRQSLPEKANIELSEKHKKDVVLLVTKEYHCLGDLLVRHFFKDLQANILAVISNHHDLGDFVHKFNIPFHFISADKLERSEHEQVVNDTITKYNPEFLVLAKYMRILTPDFIHRYKNRIVNIHHSFLPAFVGAKPYVQAHARGVKMIGATAHFVNENLDEGPIIVQEVTQVDHQMDARQLAKSGRDIEKIVLARALKLVFDDRVFVSDNKTIIL